jgi:hypothetical protein
MRRPQRLVAVLCLALAGCGGDRTNAAPQATGVVSQPAPSPSAEESQTTAPTLRGNAAINPACKLLSLDQVATAGGLNVIGVLGLPADTTNPAKHSESCTWYLDSKDVQSSLVVQYTLFAKPPADLMAYYPQVIAQGFGKAVPKLGDISKIKGHVLDTIYKRAEIHVSLLTHAEATAQDQAAAIAVMRLVMAGIRQ